MDNKTIGHAALRGWRSKFADVAATPVARRTSAGEDQIRAIIGMAFLALSIVYVVSAIRDIVRSARS